MANTIFDLQGRLSLDVKDLQLLNDEVKRLVNEIQQTRAQFAVKADTAQASSDLAALRSQVDDLTQNDHVINMGVRDGGGVQRISQAIQDLTRQGGGLNGVSRNIQDIVQGLRDVANPQTVSSVRELQNLVQLGRPKMLYSREMGPNIQGMSQRIIVDAVDRLHWSEKAGLVSKPITWAASSAPATAASGVSNFLGRMGISGVSASGGVVGNIVTLASSLPVSAGVSVLAGAVQGFMAARNQAVAMEQVENYEAYMERAIANTYGRIDSMRASQAIMGYATKAALQAGTTPEAYYPTAMKAYGIAAEMGGSMAMVEQILTAANKVMLSAGTGELKNLDAALSAVTAAASGDKAAALALGVGVSDAQMKARGYTMWEKLDEGAKFMARLNVIMQQLATAAESEIEARKRLTNSIKAETSMYLREFTKTLGESFDENVVGPLGTGVAKVLNAVTKFLTPDYVKKEIEERKEQAEKLKTEAAEAATRAWTTPTQKSFVTTTIAGPDGRIRSGMALAESAAFSPAGGGAGGRLQPIVLGYNQWGYPVTSPYPGQNFISQLAAPGTDGVKVNLVVNDQTTTGIQVSPVVVNYN